ncbi:MAG TPA: nucleotide 5'-monophosphate nucleosidase PpnN [Steroidobacteraceae bacterium]|nr:nucleotide 5'-monophosphate nucleosidase PpnN [Steroidobacteraceae bacterium]
MRRAEVAIPAGPPDEADIVDARVSPTGSLENLSQQEVDRLLDSSRGGLYQLYRRCSLAVLNSGGETDDARAIFDRYADFEIGIMRQAWGVKLELHNAPASAFVDGRMIRGIQEHLFAVLRDILYIHGEVYEHGSIELRETQGITNAVYRILRNAGLLLPRVRPDIVVCWGGHSINRDEYQYTKKVGYELGLRGLNVCTGCGPGAMKGPMKGAAIGHAKQRIHAGRYVGLTEPGIVAAEPPNAIVNQLAILPDIEKRLEAFVRLGHGIVVFPGGAGTAEEILYLIGILLDPHNEPQPFPVVFSGPRGSEEYFRQIDAFLVGTLGERVRQCYRIIVDDPPEVAREMLRGMAAVREYRRRESDAYNYNWLLRIPHELQKPFEPTHAAMASLNLRRDAPAHELAAELRRAFSGIVAGNVKESGLKLIDQYGPFELHGDPALLKPLDALLASFVRQRRMKLSGEYKPCYRIVA